MIGSGGEAGFAAELPESLEEAGLDDGLVEFEHLGDLGAREAFGVAEVENFTL